MEHKQELGVFICKRCKGKGKHQDTVQPDLVGEVVCQICKGTGKLQLCPFCGGSGSGGLDLDGNDTNCIACNGDLVITGGGEENGSKRKIRTV